MFSGFLYGSLCFLQFEIDSRNTPKKTCAKLTQVTPESSGSRLKSRLRAAGQSHSVRRTAAPWRPGGAGRTCLLGASGQETRQRPSGPTWGESKAVLLTWSPKITADDHLHCF